MSTHSFAAHALRILSFTGRLHIRPHADPRIDVTFAGPKERIAALGLKATGPTVTLTDPSARQGSGTSISVSGGSVVMTGGGDITVNGRRIDGGAPAEALEATIDVPFGALLDLQGIFDDVEIGDTRGPLNIDTQGGGEIVAGKVLETTIALKGSTEITIQEVAEALTVLLAGSGDVRVRAGSVSQLNINLAGSGDVTFRGTSAQAMLTLVGSGDIRIGPVSGRCMKSRLGTGDITVG